MALAESSIFGSAPNTTVNANRITTMFLDMYEKKEKKLGWGYSGAGEDFSVSGWVALGLKSAHQASLQSVSTPRYKKVFAQYRKWVETMTNEKKGEAYYRPGRDATKNMMYVGMFQRQFMGFPRSDLFLTMAGKNTIKLSDKILKRKEGPSDIYGLYYGTLASFQQQGKTWAYWNPLMKKLLVNSQLPGDPNKLGGSWKPGSDGVSREGGRVMTTALLTLCLEVYYRYTLMQ
ncbi:MAG: hypothetical protein HQL32_16145 [Planctomycetes bacterium]|nr:hypothetical protein [Planctomycetota bacterium]